MFFLEIKIDHFNEILETFRNKNIWYKDRGKWVIKNFPIQDWDLDLI